jgi:PKD repeat protein
VTYTPSGTGTPRIDIISAFYAGDATFGTSSGSLALTVPDLPPIAAFTFSPANPFIGQMVSFDASASRDLDGTIVNYAWDFGDGTSGSGLTTTHTFVASGTFVPTLTVTDNVGQTGTAQVSINVPSIKPGAHVSFFSWEVRPQYKKFGISLQGPVEPIQAFAVNDGNRTVWAYVKFVITGDSGVNQVLYTQVVQMTPGQVINGNESPKFAASFTPMEPSVYFVQGTVYFSTSTTQPSIGDPSFTPNLLGQATTSFVVRP